MKILLLGSNGQVGSILSADISNTYENPLLLKRDNWDMAANPRYGKEIILNNHPDIVVNAAAFTNVDLAESSYIDAYNVNSIAVSSLAEGCKILDIPFIHISTDYIFGGNNKNQYSENDLPDPINTYGKSKLMGEHSIQDTLSKFIILRTSWIFSNNDNNFVTKIINRIINDNKVFVVDDQIGGPTSAIDVSNIIMKLLETYSKKNYLKWGIYNFSGNPFLSWYDLACFIGDHLYIYNKITKKPNIRPVKSSYFKLAASRPHYSKLDTSKIEDYLSCAPSNWSFRVIEIIKSLNF